MKKLIYLTITLFFFISSENTIVTHFPLLKISSGIREKCDPVFHSNDNLFTEKIENTNRLLQCLSFLIGILLVIICVSIYSLKKKDREIEAGLNKNEGIEQYYIQKGKQTKIILTEHFKLSKKIIIMNSQVNEKNEVLLKKINEIIFGRPILDFNWTEFYILLNEIHDDLSNKLRYAFPFLTDNDIHFCCLLQAGFSTGEIAFILNFTTNTVRMKKTYLRKKIGITNGGNLNNYFEQFLEDSKKGI